MPAPTNPGVLVNNYLGGYPGGYDNHATDWRVDYDLSARNGSRRWESWAPRITSTTTGSPDLPLPYTGGDLAAIYPKDFVVGDTYTISPNLVNQLKVLLHPVLPEHPRFHAGRNGMGASCLWE